MTELRFSWLIGLMVTDASGLELGRVFDVRVEFRGGQLRVAHLLVGRRGLAARLGLDVGWRQSGEIVAWERVIDPGRDQILVRPAAS